MTNSQLQSFAKIVEVIVNEAFAKQFDLRFDAAFDRKFDAAFDRKFKEAFPREFKSAFEQQIPRITRLIKSIVDTSFDDRLGLAPGETLDDKIGNLPTKEEFATANTAIMGELATIREEQIIQADQIAHLNTTVFATN